MNQAGLAAIVAVALGCTVAVAQGGNTTQQARAGSGTAITVVGCVHPDEGGAAEAAGTTGVTGSRANATYVLTNVTVDSARSAAAPAGARGGQTAPAAAQTDAPRAAADTRSPARRPARYTLEGHDMTQYAAQQVEVTGTLALEAPGTRVEPGGGRGTTPVESPDRWIHVTSVRRIATTCPAQP